MDLSEILRAACTAILYLGTIPAMALLATIVFTLAIIISLNLNSWVFGSDELSISQAKVNKTKVKTLKAKYRLQG